MCPVLLYAENCFLIVSEGETGKSIWKNKQKTQSEEGWDDTQPKGSAAAHFHESGLEDNREHGGNGPLYTA